MGAGRPQMESSHFPFSRALPGSMSRWAHIGDRWEMLAERECWGMTLAQRAYSFEKWQLL